MTDIAGLSERLEAMTAFAKELSDALLSLRPLGGSECFVKRCGTYYADPTYFKGFIQCESDNRHEAMKDLARARKRATRAEQQRDEAYERAALQGWRTIDSAPKDGTEVLLWFPFTPDKPHWSHPAGFVFLAKWWISDGIDEDRWVDPDDCEDLGSTPTHWQPLPAPPLTAASGGEVG